MGEIKFNTIAGLGESQYTEQEYDNEIYFESINGRLSRISAALKEISNDYAIVIVGMGGKTKSIYKALASNPDVILHWSGSILPNYLKLLGHLISSESGVIEVKGLNSLTDVFELVVEQSMAGVYVFPKNYLTTFVNGVANRAAKNGFDYGIKSFSDYFYYIVDADNFESSTGVYEIVSYGVDALFIKDAL